MPLKALTLVSFFIDVNVLTGLAGLEIFFYELTSSTQNRKLISPDATSDFSKFKNVAGLRLVIDFQVFRPGGPRDQKVHKLLNRLHEKADFV